MRRLILKREKSFVACLAKDKVYIEDQMTPEININNIPCRKLGALKNGEEKTFEIDESARHLIVIGDKLSKNYCNDICMIPEGTEDVYLCGKNRYNPAAGNAFRFSNVIGEEIIQNRKKGSRRGIVVLIIAIVIGAVIGAALSANLFSGENLPKSFYAEGMSITLSSDFIENDQSGFTACYSSSKASLLILKESFSDFEDAQNMSIDDYATQVLTVNADKLPVKSVDTNGRIYIGYDYYSEEANGDISYFIVPYKSTDAFWLVQFACMKEDYKQLESQFIEWADTVSFE